MNKKMSFNNFRNNENIYLYMIYKYIEIIEQYLLSLI